MIFTFASHKGGVGRTFTMIHAGLRLAAAVRRQGLRVLLIDMDLDAPGFAPYFPELDVAACAGFAGLLAEYRAIVPEEQRVDALRQMLAPGQPPGPGTYVLEVPGAPNLALLPAGHPGLTGKGYYDVLEALRAELSVAGTEWPARRGFFGDLRRCLAQDWPCVLIDARAGLAEFSFASALVLADVLVPCFRLNQANLEGVQFIHNVFLKRQQHPDARRTKSCVVPVATPVPPRSSPKLMAWLRRAHETFFPELAQPGPIAADNDALRATVHRMYPLVHRIFEDQEASLGEWRYLHTDGSPTEGIDEHVPLLRSVDQLVEHLRALNADRDTGGAELVERHLYSEDRASAFEYWLKRARQQPDLPKIWSDLTRGYLGQGDPRLQATVRQGLQQLLEEMRVRVGAAELAGGPTTLATALIHYCRAFGAELPDAGLAVIDEAVSLAGDEPVLLETARAIAGRVVLNLLDERGLEGSLVDPRGRPLTRNLAAEHLREALRHAQTLGHPGGEIHLLLARVLRGLSRHGEAVRQLDQYLAETAAQPESSRLPHEIARVLVSQAEALEWLGHYDWALRNLLRANELVQDAVLSIDAQRLAKKCGQHKLVAQLFAQHTRLFPGDLRAYRHEALRRATLGMHDAARKLVLLTGNLEEGRSAHLILRGAVDVLADDLSASLAAFQKAAVRRSDRYTQALTTVVASLLGHRTRFAPLSGDLDEDRLPVSLAALAQSDLPSLKVLAAGWEILPRIPALDRMELGLLWTMASTLEGTEQAGEDLEVVARLCSTLPLLAVAHQTSFEGALLERIWQSRRRPGGPAGVGQVEELLGRLRTASAPASEGLLARTEGEPLPRLAFVPDRPKSA